jgi:hypothetical protein
MAADAALGYSCAFASARTHVMPIHSRSLGSGILVAGLGLFLSMARAAREGGLREDIIPKTFEDITLSRRDRPSDLRRAIPRRLAVTDRITHRDGTAAGRAAAGSVGAWGDRPAAQHAIFPASQQQKSMLAAVWQLDVLMLLLLTKHGNRSSAGHEARPRRHRYNVTRTVEAAVMRFLAAGAVAD